MNALSYEEMCRDENKQGPLCMGLNTVIWDFRLGNGREQSANDLTRKPPPTHGWSEAAWKRLKSLEIHWREHCYECRQPCK